MGCEEREKWRGDLLMQDDEIVALYWKREEAAIRETERFYVELPDLEENGMKCYSAYYVPAVKEEYISNMPTWDGSMN